jgi:hypothetical protein
MLCKTGNRCGKVMPSPTSKPFDLTELHYCLTHDSHWIPGENMKDSSCPWCHRDKVLKALDSFVSKLMHP